MNILLDCDGLLADFTGAVVALVNRRTGRTYTAEDVTQWDMLAALGEQHLAAELHREICQPGFCSKLQPFRGALAALNTLRHIGHVTIVTAPYVGSVYWMGERLDWLRQHMGVRPSARDVIFAARKEQILGDVLIDDRVENVCDFARSGRPAILWDRPYNRAAELPTDVSRALTWEDVYVRVRRLRGHNEQQL
jgi:5'(3')-deoxyribonucleotidase